MIQFTDLLESRIHSYSTLLPILIFKDFAEYLKWDFPIWYIQERIIPVSIML